MPEQVNREKCKGGPLSKHLPPQGGKGQEASQIFSIKTLSMRHFVKFFRITGHLCQIF